MKRFFGKERGGDLPPRDAAVVGQVRKIDLSSMIDVAIEVWRLQDRVNKLQAATGRKDPSIAFSIDKIQHVLREIGVEAREYTGQTYNEGMSLDVLTFDYPVEEKPINRIVQETVSPAIFFDGTLHKMAQVIVGKGDGTVDDKKHD
jgi:hypothetical protein